MREEHQLCKMRKKSKSFKRRARAARGAPVLQKLLKEQQFQKEIPCCVRSTSVGQGAKRVLLLIKENSYCVRIISDAKEAKRARVSKGMLRATVLHEVIAKRAFERFNYFMLKKH